MLPTNDDYIRWENQKHDLYIDSMDGMCNECEGRGTVPLDARGKVDWLTKRPAKYKQCQTCNGRGFIEDEED